MPSIIGHTLAGIVGGTAPIKKFASLSAGKLLVLSTLCANLPDFDVVFRYFGFDQAGFFGHRNFFHSIMFAVIAGGGVGILCYAKQTRRTKMELSIFFFLVIMSHNLLDALTLNAGVAFFHPFLVEQFTFSINPLLPAGFSLNDFATSGALVREALCVWLPCFMLIFFFSWKKIRSST